MFVDKSEISIMDISKFERELPDRECILFGIKTKNYVLLRREVYEYLKNVTDG